MQRKQQFIRKLVTAAGLLSLTIGLTGATATGEPDQDQAPSENEKSSVLLILDASGSMNRKDPSGTTRLEAAKKALNNTIDSLPANIDVGLRVYGATVKDKNDADPSKQACQDSQLIHPIEQLDRAKLKAAVNDFEAVGQTPISHALLEGAKDLGDEGNRHIILVSDGEENCVPDPCKEVESIADSGISMRIDAVGFAVNDKARNQLSCIAELTDGSYYDAKDADQLDSALRRLSARAARPFALQGEPVQGSREAQSAPELTSGQYQDKVSGSNQGDTEVFYKIKRQIPDSSLHVNVLAKSPKLSGSVLATSGTWKTSLSTLEGTECGYQYDGGLDVLRFGTLVSHTVSTYGMDPRLSTPDSKIEECAKADELILSIKRGKGDNANTLPTAIRVIEEPVPTNLDELPDGVSEVSSGGDTIDKPKPSTPKDVIGSVSFEEAETLESGSYVTEVVPGETVFFKTPIDWGQSAVFGIDGLAEDPVDPKELHIIEQIHINGDVLAPNYSNIDSHSNTGRVST
ncbi:vWA domain-containing protein [Micrococcoides hystricis]|uniref:VWA domain-containing protein n=1 Tax=Micrococcoides hystricis TaxID=1572761 RepID=A0ABV6P9R0_9MICC